MQSTSSVPNWRPLRGNAIFNAGFSSGTSQSVPQLNSNMPYRPSLESTNEKAEISSLPDPGDWDPNYSEELLLQEDGPDVGSMVSEFTNIMRISHPPDPAVPVAGMGRFNNTYQTHMNSHIPNQRNFLTNQAFPQVDASSSSAHDMHAGHGRPIMSSQFTPHSAQISPSRFGQHPPPCHRSNYVPPNFARGGEWNHQKVQPPPIYNNVGSHSLGNNTLPNGSPWGLRPGYPVTNIPPASNSRKDYGRIV
ncbi:dual specificity protein kinase YAK1 homolog [Papaver somniferum]|uniref:dual specificity protein kinase YAK1 homolog n=1 Tax=Papaver somniferum TaxID=3469 RepID=UPI000E704F8B|nr:dual specificity protein kinase YAK1 homolog [Papaver somniferum]XP_026406274.1 dual specificity protein kinase YAK1 homolog [Papaver somniferum]